MKSTRILAVAAVAALMSGTANAAFLPVLDEFWITKNLDAAGAPIEIFRDSFSDGVVPPSGPDGVGTYFVEGPAGMASESAGKLTMDPSLGIPQLNPEGNINIRTAARRIFSTNSNSGAFLGIADSFTVNTLYDLSSLPDVAASGFGVRIEDRAAGATFPPAGNDMVLLEVARTRNTGALGILFQDVNFVTHLDDVMDFVPLQPILDGLVLAGTPATQVQLSITKDAGTSVIDGFFTLFDGVGTALYTQGLDNVGNTSGLTIGIYQGEDFTRAAFQARTQVVVPEPASLALFGFGLAGLGFMRRRRRDV